MSSIVLYDAGVSSSCIVYLIVFPLNDVSNVSIAFITAPFVSVIISSVLLVFVLIFSSVIINLTPAIGKFVILSYLYKPIFKSFGMFIICMLIFLEFIYADPSKLLIISFPFIIL